MSEPEPRNWKPSLIFIVLCILLLAAVIFIMGESLRSGRPDMARVTGGREAPAPPVVPTPVRIAAEAGPFFRGVRYARDKPRPGQGVPRRDLKSFYGTRAYPGAPPFIPHDITGDMSDQTPCLSCHRQGGYVISLKAFAPPTPHPEMVNCRQCHVARLTGGLFKGTNWRKIAGPRLGRAALAGSPPAIPHPLRMRENCGACHVGPAAVKEIATSHPNRINCRQCHVPDQPLGVWRRK